jgi:hypothetical protein
LSSGVVIRIFIWIVFIWFSYGSSSWLSSEFSSVVINWCSHLDCHLRCHLGCNPDCHKRLSSEVVGIFFIWIVFWCPHQGWNLVLPSLVVICVIIGYCQPVYSSGLSSGLSSELSFVFQISCRLVVSSCLSYGLLSVVVLQEDTLPSLFFN